MGFTGVSMGFRERVMRFIDVLVVLNGCYVDLKGIPGGF